MTTIPNTDMCAYSYWYSLFYASLYLPIAYDAPTANVVNAASCLCYFLTALSLDLSFLIVVPGLVTQHVDMHVLIFCGILSKMYRFLPVCTHVEIIN